MMRIHLLFLCSVYLLLSNPAFAQKQDQARINALLKNLQNARDDTGKVNLLITLAFSYNKTDPGKGLIYGKRGLDLAEQLGWKEGVAKACGSLGSYSVSSHDYPVAVDYFTRGLKIAEEQGDKQGERNFLKSISNIYSSQHDYSKALDFCSRCLKLSEAIGNTQEIAENQMVMGSVYYGQRDFSNAMEHYQQALKINLASGDKKQIAKNLECISSVYNKQKDYNNALDFGLRSLKISEDIDDMQQMANSELNIGNIYNAQSDRVKALDYWQRALKHFPKTGETGHLSQTYQNIAALYLQGGNFAQALENSTQAFRLREKEDDKAAMAYSLSNMGNDYQALAGAITTVHLPDSIASFTGAQLLRRAEGCMQRAITLEKDREDCDLLSTTYLHLSQVQASLGDSVGSRESFRKYNNYLASVYNQDKKNDLVMKDMQDVFVQKQENMQEQLEHNALQYEYEKKQAEAKTDLERQQLKYEEELKQQQITSDYKQKELILEQKIALDRVEQEKQIAIKAEQVKQARQQRDYTLTGLGMLALLTLGLLNRFSVMRKIGKTLESKNKQIEAEKENADAMRERAERSEQFKQQFLANMSHEIRTPMNAVSGMTEILLEKNPRKDQEGYLQAISKSSDILLHIINDILDLSKIEAGKMVLETIDFSLSDTLQQVKDTLSHKADDKGLQLMVHVDDNVAQVLAGDPYRLNQVLINLGGNAIKFTERGGVEISVKQEQETKERVKLRFSVSDTGIGIPADKINTLFTNFTQVNSSDTRKYGGTGLGLSISRQLVELQGGHISVESTPGSGTTFSFTLSYLKGSKEKLLQRSNQEKGVKGAILNGLRILVADDNEYNRLVVQETLQLKSDVQISMAVNGKEAVDMMAQHDFDVVLMDVQMPELNGIDATRVIRQMKGPKSKIPIVALTASILRNDIDKCLQCGMNSYVPKPFKSWQLISALAEVTSRKTDMTMQGSDDPEINNNYKIKQEKNAITDFTYLTRFCEGDEARMKKYVGIYLNSVPVFKDKVKAATEAKDLNELAQQLHAFKPNWMIMGMKSTGELGSKIEHLCRDMNTTAYEKIGMLMEQTDRSVIELGGFI